MVEVKVTGSTTTKKTRYPCLLEGKVTGKLVLALSEDQGIVLYRTGIACDDFEDMCISGYFREGGSFRSFDGKITLSNT